MVDEKQVLLVEIVCMSMVVGDLCDYFSDFKGLEEFIKIASESAYQAFWNDWRKLNADLFAVQIRGETWKI